MNVKTQTVEDFQCLCNGCNLMKRQICKRMKETGKRYGATNIPSMEIWGIDFVEGDESYEPTDINAMVGTYWYEPVEFMKKVKNKYKK